MKKQFLPILAASLMLGGASQINAMDEDDDGAGVWGRQVNSGVQVHNGGAEDVSKIHANQSGWLSNVRKDAFFNHVLSKPWRATGWLVANQFGWLKNTMGNAIYKRVFSEPWGTAALKRQELMEKCYQEISVESHQSGISVFPIKINPGNIKLRVLHSDLNQKTATAIVKEDQPMVKPHNHETVEAYKERVATQVTQLINKHVASKDQGFVSPYPQNAKSDSVINAF